MSTIVTRAGKGSPLTNTEMDSNLTNLNNDKLEGPASSIDSEIALFSGTGGKTIKRASLSGIVKATSGVASAATDGTDYISPTAQQNQTVLSFTTGGTSTAFTLTPSPAVSALAAGQEFDVTFHAAAGTTPTLSISGLTAKLLKYRDGTGAKQAVTATQIPSGWRSKVVYDGTDYIVREIASAGSNVVTGMTYQSGRYYGPTGAVTQSSFTTPASTYNGKILLVPIQVRATQTFTAICCYVSTLIAAKTIRLGIYADNKGVPGSLVLDAGTASFATTGQKDVSISQSLNAGWYWLAFLTDSTATGVVRGISFIASPTDSSMFVDTPMGLVDNATSTPYNHMTGTQAYGAMPSSLPALTAAGNASTYGPLITLKV